MTSKLYFLVMLVVFSNCSSKEGHSKMSSKDIASASERVTALSAEIKAPSQFVDAEFDLFNVNGFSNSRNMVPGASHWDYRFAIKTDSSNVDSWLHGLDKVDSADISWTIDVIDHRKHLWNITGSPEIYKSNDQMTSAVVYRSEGIVFKIYMGR